MSNALAIAAVTRVLQDLLNNGLIDADVSDRVGNVPVTALPPDRLVNGGTEPNRLNLFLYNVSQNPGWRNVDLPSRDAAGLRSTNPPLALDLHYLVTAYGEQELNAEILLGYAMQLLHETPVLSRAAIRRSLRTTADGEAVGTTILPSALRALVASDLAEQVELIKITPAPMSSEEMSKLWTALQTHYRPSAAYHLSVVLIQREMPKRTPLPVLTRGRRLEPPTGRDAGVSVLPSLVPPVPTLTTIVLPQEQVAARLGETITLEGHHLAGTAVMVHLVADRDGEALTLLPTTAFDGVITVTLPSPTEPPDHLAGWRVGIYRVSVEIRSAEGEVRTTNALPLVLAPLLMPEIRAERRVADDSVTFTVTCSPPMRQGQTASLIVGDREMIAEPIPAPPTTTLTFRGTGFTSGRTLPVRLRIDGIDSILIDRTARPPAFDSSQQVTIP